MPLSFPALDAAIGQAEGYGKPGTIPTLANNPGDVIVSPFATSHGAIGSITAAGGAQIAVFPDTATGFAATDALAQSKISGGATDPTSFAQSWLGTSADPVDVTNWANVISSNFPGATTPAPVSAGGTPATSSIPGWLQSLNSAASLAMGNPIGTTSGGIGSFSWGRVAAFLLGIVVLGGAIFLSKPVQQNIVQPITGAVKGTVRRGAVGAAGL